MEELGTRICFSHMALTRGQQSGHAFKSTEEGQPVLQEGRAHIVVVKVKDLLFLFFSVFACLGSLDDDLGSTYTPGMRSSSSSFGS